MAREGLFIGLVALDQRRARIAVERRADLGGDALQRHALGAEAAVDIGEMGHISSGSGYWRGNWSVVPSGSSGGPFLPQAARGPAAKASRTATTRRLRGRRLIGCAPARRRRPGARSRAPFRRRFCGSPTDAPKSGGSGKGGSVRV